MTLNESVRRVAHRLLAFRQAFRRPPLPVAWHNSKRQSPTRILAGGAGGRASPSHGRAILAVQAMLSMPSAHAEASRCSKLHRFGVVGGQGS